MTNFTRIPQAPTLVVYDLTDHARGSRIAQAPVLVVQSGAGTPRIPQSPIVVVYNEGPTSDFTLRAWPFTLDGHQMYALSLGSTYGTYVFDVLTSQWAQWQTQGYEPVWNAVQGCMWLDRIVALDTNSGDVWEVDPEGDLDEGFRPVKRSATALLSARARGTRTLGAITVNGTVGFPTGETPTVTLRFSDNGGRAWVTMPSQEVLATDDDASPLQLLAWRSLGSFGQPGRIIEIIDEGAMVKLSDTDMLISGDEDD